MILAAASVALMLNQAACSLAASGLPPAPAGTACDSGSTIEFKDDFDDNTTGVQWKKSSVAGITVSEATRQVEISSMGMPGRWASYNWDLAGQGTRSLLGCHVTIEVISVLSEGEQATSYLLLKSVNQDEEITFKQTAGTLSMIALIGAAPPHQKDLPYKNVEHRWWKIEESDGTVSWKTSPDGKVWAELTSAPTPPFADAVTVSFGAGADGSFFGGTAVFDNLNTDAL
jgi:hypothetical protein